jgi:energy-coupling factor transport system permease protein
VLETIGYGMAASQGLLEGVHPVIRVVSLILFCSGVAQARSAVLALALVVMVALYVTSPKAVFWSAWRMLRRVRWFFFSLGILYFWFTPGDPLWGAAGAAAWVPTQQGLAQGCHRIAALALIVLAVNLVLESTHRQQLMAAWHWLLGPLQWFGVDRERIALRLSLVLANVEAARSLMSDAREAGVSSRRSVRHIGTVMGNVLVQALERAQSVPLRSVTISLGDAPPVWQWLYPCAVLLGFTCVG